MKKYTHKMTPGEAFHPSETVREELEAAGKKQSDLVKASGLNKSFISLFMKGERSISVNFALVLEKVLEIPAEFWIKLQKGYELDLELIELRKIRTGFLNIYQPFLSIKSNKFKTVSQSHPNLE